MGHSFSAGEGSLYSQRNGPNTEPVYAGCHEIGDVTIPEGDVTLFYCPDPSAPNKFIVTGSVQGAAGAPTTSITADYTEDLDDLERVRFPFTLFVNHTKRGRKDNFANRDRSLIFLNARITQRGYSNLATRTPDNNNKSEVSYELTAEAVIVDANMTVARQTISETNSINNIRFCNEAQQRTDDSVARDSCEIGFATCDRTSTAVANVLYTSNGATWAASAADPFAASEDINGLVCFEISRDTTRVIVGRGTTDAGNPPEIAYSDNNGTTWTTVNINATNALFLPNPHSLFALDSSHIWVGLDNGYIYFSEDGGLTWTAQESGTINTGDWNVIKFVNTEVGWAGGETNELARTLDGGDTWSAITGPSARNSDNVTALEVLDQNRAWIGYSTGYLYYTLDGGTTWTQRTFSGSASGSVKDIEFYNDLLGFMIHNTSAPVGRLFKTIDGGYTWELVTMPTNAGVNDLFICDQWKVFIAGEAQGSLGFIAKGAA